MVVFTCCLLLSHLQADDPALTPTPPTAPPPTPTQIWAGWQREPEAGGSLQCVWPAVCQH